MEKQEKISFENYDFVEINYISSYDQPMILPFYSFYKKIKIAPNGNEIYAKTNVCAIEVSEYDEYFENQKSNHK